MDSETAREFTESLDQTGLGIGQAAYGWWRQIAVGVRLNVPKALGMPRAEWTSKRRAAIGNLQLQEERRQAVAELTTPLEEGGEGLNNSEAADVLGVGETTVRRARQDGEKKTESETEIRQDGEPIEDRLARLDDDLVARVRAGLSIDEAETIHAQNERQVDKWAIRIREGLTVLARMAGYPIPDGIRNRLSDDEASQLRVVLEALTSAKEETHERSS